MSLSWAIASIADIRASRFLLNFDMRVRFAALMARGHYRLPASRSNILEYRQQLLLMTLFFSPNGAISEAAAPGTYALTYVTITDR